MLHILVYLRLCALLKAQGAGGNSEDRVCHYQFPEIHVCSKIPPETPKPVK